LVYLLIYFDAFVVVVMMMWYRYAMTCCGTANATVVNEAAATIAAIANVILLWFIDQSY
jgi:hypothetical protein